MGTMKDNAVKTMNLISETLVLLTNVSPMQDAAGTRAPRPRPSAASPARGRAPVRHFVKAPLGRWYAVGRSLLVVDSALV